MISTPPLQILKMLLSAFLCGGALGVFYDALRLTRVFLGFHYLPERSKILKNRFLKKFPPRSNENIENKFLYKFVLFFEDLFFVITSALIFILILYYGNDGRFRLLALIVYALGFACYYLTLGKMTVLFFDIWAIYLRALFRYIIYYLLLPVKFILKKISYFIIKTLENIRIKIYNERERKTLIKMSEKGMLKKYGN